MAVWPIEVLETLPIAVMPTVFLGGPLALLAFLFPAACGGLIIFLRRWRTVLSVLSVASTLYLLHGWFYWCVFDSWWQSLLELWFCLTAIAIAGLIRQRAVAKSNSDADLPLGTKTDSIILCLAAITCFGWVVFGDLQRRSGIDPRPIIAVGVGAVAGAWHSIRIRHLNGKEARWDVQSVALAGAIVTSSVFLTQVGWRAIYPESIRLQWAFVPSGTGVVHSSPVVVDGCVYAAAALSDSSGRRSGSLYCINRHTGKSVWAFDDNGRMKQVLSSPCHANGRIYIGEGFHSDASCKLYCISASDGAKLWEFETRSHTESTPSVAGGRVYFGAGDDGLYCLNAMTGEMVWHFEGPHVDGCPTVMGGRVYAGSGYGQREVFCVDSTNGSPIWRVPIDVSSFSAAAVSGGHVFFGVGNGSFSASDPIPAGALLCVDSQFGDIKWRYDVSDAVHSRPLVLGDNVVFVSRDHCCYCLGIGSGKLKWKRNLGSPIIAAPSSANIGSGNNQEAIVVLTQDGCLCLLAIDDGGSYGIQDLRDICQVSPTIISSPAIELSDSRLLGKNRLYFGGSTQGPAPRPVLFCLE